MGKLIEKLRQVAQGSGGSFGFFGRGQAASAPARPAAVIVTLGASDVAAAEAVAKAGVDAVIIAGWKPGTDVTTIKSALESANTLWGVEYARGAEEEVSIAAQKAGASFLLLGADAPAAALYDQVDQFDRIITLTAPQNEMELMLFRVTNTLPAQVAIAPLSVGVAELPTLPLNQAARLALLTSTARFPLLAVVDDTPSMSATRMLVRLGFDGIVLAGAGMSASQISQQVQSVRADLEKIPLDEAQEHGGVSLSGLMGNLGAGVQPNRPDHE